MDQKLHGIALDFIAPAVKPIFQFRARQNGARPDEKGLKQRELTRGQASRGIAGRGIANPIGQIWTGAMMLEHLGHKEAAGEMISAIEFVLRQGIKTPDLGGQATTAEVTAAVVKAIGVI